MGLPITMLSQLVEEIVRGFVKCAQADVAV